MCARAYDKPDFWSQKAFSEGYPARSVYKLQEIDEKFGVFGKSGKILDLGASPGSWTMFALKKVGDSGQIVAIDLKDLSKKVRSPKLKFILGDLYADNVCAEAQKDAPYDFVMSDAAPATTGNRVIDAAQSASLAELAFFYAKKMLKVGGNFVAKIFQGGDERTLLAEMRKVFDSAKSFKPKACRAESFETYLVGLGKKGMQS